MLFQKLVARYRVETEVNGDDRKWELDPHAGGHTAKVAQFSLVIVEKSSTSAQLSLSLEHGPDGRNFALHSEPINETTLNANQTVLIGDADSSKVLGEWLRPTIIVGSTGASSQWVVVDVYLMTKPF